MFPLLQILQLGVQASAQDQEIAAQQKQSRANELIARTAATDAYNRGNQLAGRIRLQGSQLAAKQHTAYANSGVDASEGTAAEVQGSTAALTELDAQTAMNNAAREAWGFKMTASKYYQEQGVMEQRRKNLATSTAISGIGDLASGYASAGMGGGK